jgi:hypothetical protein
MAGYSILKEREDGMKEGSWNKWPFISFVEGYYCCLQVTHITLATAARSPLRQQIMQVDETLTGLAKARFDVQPVRVNR